jgi:hypothetical protein
MVLSYLQRGVAASLVIAVAALLADGRAAAGELVAGSPGVFYNYYAQPGAMATLYPSPLPTPPLVGRTAITYQPLLAQEFLYDHARTYTSHQPGAGMSRTHVHWNTRRVPAIVHAVIGPRGPLHTNNNF